MRYYQCDKYPIEFVLSENIDKHFDSHNHVGHYVISMVMQGVVTVYLENREAACRRGDVFIIPPYSLCLPYVEVFELEYVVAVMVIGTVVLMPVTLMKRLHLGC